MFAHVVFLRDGSAQGGSSRAQGRRQALGGKGQRNEVILESVFFILFDGFSFEWDTGFLAVPL